MKRLTSRLVMERERVPPAPPPAPRPEAAMDQQLLLQREGVQPKVEEKVRGTDAGTTQSAAPTAPGVPLRHTSPGTTRPTRHWRRCGLRPASHGQHPCSGCPQTLLLLLGELSCQCTQGLPAHAGCRPPLPVSPQGHRSSRQVMSHQGPRTSGTELVFVGSDLNLKLKHAS